MIHKTNHFLAVAVFAFLTGCQDRGVDPDFSGIPDPYTRWQAYGLRSYTLEQTQNCFCGNGGVRIKLTVEDDQIVGAVKVSDGTTLPLNQWTWYKTVEELFQIVREVEQDTVWFQVQYDERHGFPKKLFVDPFANAADDEYGFETSNLRRQ